MNWIDVIVIIVALVGIFVGWRIGFLGAIFATAGLYVGMVLAGQLTDDIAEALTDSVSSDAIATALAYAIVVGGSLAAALVARSMVKKMLNFVFLGWINSVGSLALGLIAGVLLGGALITFAARYSNDLPEVDGIGGTIIEMTGIRGNINDALVESSLVPLWLDIVDAVPGSALGMVPDDFKLALEDLQWRIDLIDAAEKG